MQDYWWVTRPKRKLNPIPEELAAFCSTALGKKWTRNRDSHIEFEIELEQTGTKRVGERRDASGSGGRTHAAMLYSLGLWFEKNETVFLTLAGEAIMQGKSLVPVLKKQVLRFQYPSAYSASVKVAPRFKIRPFYFFFDNSHTLIRMLLYIIAPKPYNSPSFKQQSLINFIIPFLVPGYLTNPKFTVITFLQSWF